MPSDLDFPPTETLTHLRCPTLRRFERDKWVVKGAPWTPNMVVGAAMSVALAHYLKNPTEEGYTSSLAKAEGHLKAHSEESEHWTVNALFTLVKRGFKTAVETTVKDMLLKEEVIDTELSIGRGRLDFVSAVDGSLIVTDHKTKIQIKPYYLETELKETEFNWQLRDYAWRGSNYYGRPVRYLRKHILVLSPKPKCHERLYFIKSEAIEQWSRSAERIWAQMDADDKLPFNELPMNLTRCLDYGGCPALDACHTLFRDEKAMESIYIRRKK